MYVIKNYSAIYENNRTRELKTVKWIALPVKLDGDGYATIMQEEDGAAIFGAWIACLEVAAKTKGIFIRSNGEAHSSASLSRITRVSENIISRMLLISERIGWIENTGCGNPAGIPQEGAGLSHESAGLLCSVMSCNVSVLSSSLKSAEKLSFDRLEYCQSLSLSETMTENIDTYLADQKSRGKAFKKTDNAEKLFIKKVADFVARYGEAQTLICICTAIESGWKTIYEPKPDFRQSKPDQKLFTAEQRAKEIAKNGF